MMTRLHWRVKMRCLREKKIRVYLRQTMTHFPSRGMMTRLRERRKNIHQECVMATGGHLGGLGTCQVQLASSMTHGEFHGTDS